MNSFSTIFNENKKSEAIICLTLLLLAFIIRLIGLIFYIDDSGDAPIVAIEAYKWSRNPHIITHGVQLPGLTYIAGIFHFVVAKPLISVRILNFILGTITVPIFYLLVKKVFGFYPAIISGSILVVFPLHIGLSVSSLREASFLFEIVTGQLLLILACERHRSQILYLSVSILLFSFAIMTRYEAWLFIPVLSIYFFCKSKQLLDSVIIILILLTFPVFWIVGNYINADNMFNFISGPSGQMSEFRMKRSGFQSVSFIESIKILSRRSFSHLGSVIPLGMGLGIILQIKQMIRKNINYETLMYVSIVGIYWIFMIYYTMVRGPSLRDRFLLFGFVITLPFFILPFTFYFRNYRRWLLPILLISITSIIIQSFFIPPYLNVTRNHPTEIKKVTVWLKNSSYRDDSILITEMPKIKRQSRYIPLFFPEISSRYLIMSDLVSDSRLKEFLKSQHPSLLISSYGDDEFQARLAPYLKREISQNRLVYQEGNIKVYDLVGLCCK